MGNVLLSQTRVTIRPQFFSCKVMVVIATLHVVGGIRKSESAHYVPEAQGCWINGHC